MEFKEKLKQYQNLINNELKKHIRTHKCLEEVLNKSMEYSLMAGGKRLRPILVLATFELFKNQGNDTDVVIQSNVSKEIVDFSKCMPYAIAIEMIHNFSLIHDDLPGIDNDDFRHGKPTNHKQFNEATAILAGDALLNNAYMVISEDIKNAVTQNMSINNKLNYEDLQSKIQVFKEFSIAIDRMIAGEYVDTEYEGKNISIEDLEYIHQNKTGALLTLCVRMGAILANAMPEELENITKYSKYIGLAFQVKDDILSVEGNEKELGKPIGNDEKNKKCTYVSKYGLDGAKDILDDLIEDAIECLEKYKENAGFLRDIAIFIKNRTK